MKYYEVDQNYKLSNKKGKGDQFLDWFNDKTNVSMKVMGGIDVVHFVINIYPHLECPR